MASAVSGTGATSASTHPSTRRRSSMTTQPSTIDLSREVTAALDAADVAKLSALVTDDVRLQFGSQEPTLGKGAFIEAFEASLASVEGFQHEIKATWESGDDAVIEMVVHYRRHDGSQISLP